MVNDAVLSFVNKIKDLMLAINLGLTLINTHDFQPGQEIAQFIEIIEREKEERPCLHQRDSSLSKTGGTNCSKARKKNLLQRKLEYTNEISSQHL